MSDVDARRLRWRCRRGHLELDLVLQRFLVDVFPTLSPGERNAFVRVLALPDTALMQALFPAHPARASEEFDLDAEMSGIVARLAPPAAAPP